MKYIISFALISIVCTASAQPKGTPAVIGQPLPDFAFNVQYGEPGVKKLSALRGKPVLLYFFGKGCVGSFYNLPKINELYKRYPKEINIIAVASDKGDRIAETYEVYRTHYDFELPVAIDSIVYKQLCITGFPTLILLDATGDVQAVTYAISEEAIEQFLEGKPFFFHNTSQQAKELKKFDPRKPIFIHGNGGSADQLLQRSLISKWEAGMPRITLPPADENTDPFSKIESLNAVGVSLAELYRIAYFGRAQAWEPWDSIAYGNFHFNVMLELSDSSLFAYDLEGGKNMFNYNQVLQSHMRTKESMMSVMRTDLKNCFGYDVTVETRKMPYLRLISMTGSEKLKAIPGKRRGKGDNVGGVEFYNQPLLQVLLLINSSVRLSTLDLPLLDETGITGNVDIIVKGVITSLKDVTRALRTQGLDIVRGEREMKVIVIRDPADQLK